MIIKKDVQLLSFNLWLIFTVWLLLEMSSIPMSHILKSHRNSIDNNSKNWLSSSSSICNQKRVKTKVIVLIVGRHYQLGCMWLERIRIIATIQGNGTVMIALLLKESLSLGKLSRTLISEGTLCVVRLSMTFMPIMIKQ